MCVCGSVAVWVFNSMSPAPTSLRGCGASRNDGSRHRWRWPARMEWPGTTRRVCGDSEIRGKNTRIRSSAKKDTRAAHLLQGVHAQTLLHARAVREERGQHGFEDEAKVQSPIAHALLEDGVTTRLADDQIGPLHNHNRDEEGRVAGVLQGLAVAVGLVR